MSGFERYIEGLLDKLGLGHIKGSWEDARIPSGGDTELYAAVFEADAQAPSVVFIPGTSIYALCYAELLYGFYKHGINVVGFDPRGQGRSTGIRGDYTVMDHVEDAGAACAFARERFGGPVYVMGSSQGGIEAFYMAAADGVADGYICHNLAELTSAQSLRLTRFGPAGPVSGRLKSLSPWTISSLRAAARVFPYARVPIASYLDLRKEPMKVFGDAWSFILQDPLALRSITLRAFASIAGTPLPRPVEDIQGPLLVLHSSGDHIFPEDYVMDIYNRLGCEKEIKVYQAPHLVTIEHVPEILPDLVEWVWRKARGEGG
ncbi:MAG: alpha/beta fold hydrolase [bacterium]